MSPRRAEGAVTLVEILVAAAILALVSAVALAALHPALAKLGWNDRRQDKTQGTIVAREFLESRLSPARVLPPVKESSLTYILPKSVDTEWGRLPSIDETESQVWDEGLVYTVQVDLESRLVETSSDNGLRVVWRLPPGSTMKVVRDKTPVLVLRFEAPAQRDSAPWTIELPLYVRGLP